MTIVATLVPFRKLTRMRREGDQTIRTEEWTGLVRDHDGVTRELTFDHEPSPTEILACIPPADPAVEFALAREHWRRACIAMAPR